MYFELRYFFNKKQAEFRMHMIEKKIPCSKAKGGILQYNLTHNAL